MHEPATARCADTFLIVYSSLHVFSMTDISGDSGTSGKVVFTMDCNNAIAQMQLTM